MKKALLFSLIIMLVIVACSPKSAPSKSATVSGMPEMASISSEAADISAGHVLFTTKCTKCHKAKDKYVSGHTYSEALGVLNSMAKKANLTQDEIMQLAAYVNSVAKK